MDKPFEWRKAPKAHFAVLGDPISHTRSPAIHQAAYSALGLEYKYVAVRVPAEEFSEAAQHLSDLGYHGVNVTVPLKSQAARWSKHPDKFVARVGAANTINFLDNSSTNTDADGFMDTLPAIGVWSPAPVLLLGAGGAARALLAAMCDAGHRVKVYNRTPERAKQMIADLGVKADVVKEPNPEGVALVVNATSASLDDEAVPVQWHRADRKTIAYDISYSSELSPFLLKAGLGGLKVVDGLEMLVAQAARSLEWWLGMVAPLDAMRRAAG